MKEVVSIYLYGSISTGRSNEYSDVDVLVIYNKKIKYTQKKEIERKIKRKFPHKDLDISYYSLRQIINMANEGSLLIWHLKLEGTLLEGEKIDSLVDDISEFKYYKENYFTYRRLFLDVKSRIINDNYSLFDINLMAVLFRNLLILTSNRFGNKKFDKCEVFDDCLGRIIQLNDLCQDYKELVKIRGYYKTGKNYPNVNINAIQYLKALEKVINKVGKLFNMRTDLQISYAMISNVEFWARYNEFESTVYLERGIYNILSRECNGLEFPSRKYFEMQKKPIFREGITLLKENKIYRKMSSNYDENPTFLIEKGKNNIMYIKQKEDLLKSLSMYKKIFNVIKIAKIQEWISEKIEDIEYEIEIFEIENLYLKKLKKFMEKYD